MTVIETEAPETATTGELSGEADRVAMRRWLRANLPASSLPIEFTLSGIASAPISWFAIRCSRKVRPWPP